MADTPTAAQKETAFQRFIAPIVETWRKFAAADADGNKVLDAKEVSNMAIAGWRNNPNNNDANLTQMKALASQAAALREEIDGALSSQNKNPRTLLLSRVVANQMNPDDRSPLLEKTKLADQLRSHLQRFASETGQTLDDGGAAIANEVAQGMLALKKVQTGIKVQTDSTRAILRENLDQLPFAQRDLNTEIADEKRIDERVKAANASRLKLEQMLDVVQKAPAASGKRYTAEEEFQIRQLANKATGPQGQEEAAKALAKFFDTTKADLLKSGAAKKTSDELPGAMRSALDEMEAGYTAQLRKMNKGADLTDAQKQLVAEQMAGYGKAAGEVTAQLTPKAINAELVKGLDAAKTSILQTPEQEAAEYRAGKTGFNANQLADIVEARKTLSGFTEVQQPTVQQFNQAVQAAAQAPRGR